MAFLVDSRGILVAGWAGVYLAEQWCKRSATPTGEALSPKVEQQKWEKNARRICQTRTTKQPKRNAVSKHPIPSVMCQASAWKLKSNQTHDPVITVIHRTALGLYEANVPHLVLYNCYSQGHSFEIATLHLSHCPWRLHANLMHALVFYLKLNHT